MDKIKLGVSTCLMGENVRYDGGHKRDPWIMDVLAPYVTFYPACPEHECGMPIPRESMHLEGTLNEPKLLTTKNRIDLTNQMNQWTQKRLISIGKLNLDGYILKSKSPSCGQSRIKYFKNGKPVYLGAGVFSKKLMESFPLLPMEDEGRLHDFKIRENFIQRIFAMKRWRLLVEGRKTIRKLLEFHTAHKLLIMSHSLKHYKEMGILTATGADRNLYSLYEEYFHLFSEAMAIHSTIKKNTNVLQHVQGYFKKNLDKDEKIELVDLIEQYRQGFIPLIVPITLLCHYVRKYKIIYLQQQVYLRPHPFELSLRNHV